MIRFALQERLRSRDVVLTVLKEGHPRLLTDPDRGRLARTLDKLLSLWGRSGADEWRTNQGAHRRFLFDTLPGLDQTEIGEGPFARGSEEKGQE